MTEPTFNIQWAKVMTPEEISIHNKSLFSKHNKTKESSIAIINEQSDLLIQYFHEKESDIRRDVISIFREQQKALKAYRNDECICGKKLTYVKSYDFWGCPDHRDKEVIHKSYKENKDKGFGAPKVWQSRLTRNYISDLIRERSLKNKINAKALYNFYKEQGFPDLLEKYSIYDDQSYSNQINRFTEVKDRANKFEEQCHERLRPLYTTVKAQFHVKFKRVDRNYEEVCILDFLCSNEKTVDIYECKTNESDIDQAQNLKYISVIKHLNKSTGRPVNLYNLVEVDGDKSFANVRQIEYSLKPPPLKRYTIPSLDLSLFKQTHNG